MGEVHRHTIDVAPFVHGLDKPWAIGHPINLYKLDGVVYIPLSNLCALIKRAPGIRSRIADHVIETDLLTPGVHWPGSRRLKFVIRVDALREVIPYLKTWSKEKIDTAVGQLEWAFDAKGKEEEEDEDEGDQPPTRQHTPDPDMPMRKRKIMFDADVTTKMEQKLDELIELARSAAIDQLKNLIDARFNAL